MAATCLGCGNDVTGKIRRGRCERCYRAHLRQLKRDGAYVSQVTPTADASLARVGATVLNRIEISAEGCWRYKGSINADGYGIVDVSRRFPQIRAHRAAWEAVVGPIPAGMELDHLCHGRDADCLGGAQCMHRRCVNPTHLEPVPGSVNTARGKSLSSINAQKTHCLRGHAFTPENTYWRPTRNGKPLPSRQCRQCIQIRRKRYRGAA